MEPCLRGEFLTTSIFSVFSVSVSQKKAAEYNYFTSGV